jgi:hypothetical protein
MQREPTGHDERDEHERDELSMYDSGLALYGNKKLLDAAGVQYPTLVLNDLRVASFVDSYALGGRRLQDVEAEGPEASRRHFGGTMAPILELELDGSEARLAT